MIPSTPVQDLATQWKTACRLYPIYFELAREFAIEVKTCADLDACAETPDQETVEAATRWLDELDQVIQVHQLRQFLQTSSSLNQDALMTLVRHFLAKTEKTEATRDKIDFLLVQYFSQLAPTGVSDADVNLDYVARSLEPVLGEVELKPPVWVNALDRVLEGATRCRSLDELLHGGILEQGRKAKGLAGDLFYLPVALVAFTRFGYLMRRGFFRLMLGDLNVILDGLSELEDQGVTTIDCRRAQFSAQEPIIRLRMICQSWKVMFQAEYSSGQPLRMLVDLRASVDQALGRGKAREAEAGAEGKIKPNVTVNPTVNPTAKPAGQSKAPAVATKASASAAAAGAAKSAGVNAPASAAKPKAKGATPNSDVPEFEISSAPSWDPGTESLPGKKS
jgi:hypothetical protein